MNKKIMEHGHEILASKNYDSMKDFIQHGNISVHEHCLRVAEMSLKINEKLKKINIRLNERAIVRGALLHDYFLYDWHDKTARHKLHGFYHPGVALSNAEKEFGLTDRERDIISKHMFPLTITKIPRYRDAWVVSAADKWCSVVETVRMRKKRYNEDGQELKPGA